MYKFAQGQHKPTKSGAQKKERQSDCCPDSLLLLRGTDALPNLTEQVPSSLSTQLVQFRADFVECNNAVRLEYQVPPLRLSSKVHMYLIRIIQNKLKTMSELVFKRFCQNNVMEC